MNKNKTIKEIYKCTAITSDKPLFPLQEWYNQLIEKTTAEIDVADILRMIRQKVFIDLAIAVATKLLLKDIFAGELYEGEVIEKLSEVESSLLKPFSDELHDLVPKALAACVTHEWSYEGEDAEFKESLGRLFEKIA